MENDNIYTYSKTNNHYLKKIGAYVKKARMAQKKTQAELAELAGVNRSTVVNLEQGKSVNLMSFVQIMRYLDLLSIFEIFETKEQISPMYMAAREQEQKYRIRKQPKTNNPSINTLDW